MSVKTSTEVNALHPLAANLKALAERLAEPIDQATAGKLAVAIIDTANVAIAELRQIAAGPAPAAKPVDPAAKSEADAIHAEVRRILQEVREISNGGAETDSQVVKQYAAAVAGVEKEQSYLAGPQHKAPTEIAHHELLLRQARATAAGIVSRVRQAVADAKRLPALLTKIHALDPSRNGRLHHVEAYRLQLFAERFATFGQQAEPTAPAESADRREALAARKALEAQQAWIREQSPAA